MIFVGIDVAKNKHDCFIFNSEGLILEESFTFSNNSTGFNKFKAILIKHSPNLDNIKVGLESTGHYSNNIVNFINKNSLELKIFNPLAVNLYRKALTLRKTKTDKIDAQFIAQMLFSDDSEPYLPIDYHIKELKSLSRHRYRMVGHRGKLKISLTRILDISFPELSSLVYTVHQKSCYALLLECPTIKDISKCHLTKLTNILSKASKGQYNREKAKEIKELAKRSIGTSSISIRFELQQTIRLIQNIQHEIDLLDKKMKELVEETQTPLLTIPGISYVLASIILSETGSIKNFSNSGKLLAFAGLEPSTHQSGKYRATMSRMVKRGSKYLRWALMQAARTVSERVPIFKEYLALKRSQGKHYLVAMSHVAKKLLRVIFHLLKNDEKFVSA